MFSATGEKSWLGSWSFTYSSGLLLFLLLSGLLSSLKKIYKY